MTPESNPSNLQLSTQLKASKIRGLETTWLEAGEPGRPIVFMCHGFPDDAYVWQEQIKSLSSRFHVVAPFIRGCHGSEAADELRRYTPEAVLLDHLDILKSCEKSPQTTVTVVGHDLGVVHALELARVLGSRLSRVIVANGLDCDMFAKRLNSSSQALRSWYMAVMQVPLIPETLIRVAPRTVSWLAGEIGGLPEHLRDHKGFEQRTLAPLNQYRAFARQISTNKATQKPRIRAPMLVLWGRDDGFLEAPTKAEWELVATNVTIRILKGGHWLQRESAAEVNEIISEFLDQQKVSK
jgi:pimeloyl-ACP methyl ester carboxylesterase